VGSSRISFQAEILPKAHDEKNARRGYHLVPLQGTPVAHALSLMRAAREHAPHSKHRHALQIS